MNTADRKLVEGGVEAKTVQTMENIKAFSEASGAKLSDIVNANNYIKDI